MANKFIWGLFVIIFVSILLFILFGYKQQNAGDIVEYFGTTESLINHGGVDLSADDQVRLEKKLAPAYFEDPQYYIKGVDEKRYPVHFFFYSLLILPIRLILNLFQINELLSLAITNLIIFGSVIFVLLKFYIKDTLKRFLLLLFVFLSPYIFFITWPGPDLYYISLLLWAVFALFAGQIFLAALLVTFASWHSQPLIVVAIATAAYYVLQPSISTYLHTKKITVPFRKIGYALLLGVLALIPYFYNYAVFGVLTPWTEFANGWTQLNGFGMQNASFRKFFEQFFDLNMGLFVYAPLLLFFGVTGLVLLAKKDKKIIVVLLVALVAGFFYQTNPAWHYGTAGFGPSRHAIFLLPLFIYFAVNNPLPIGKYITSLIIIAAFQLYPLSFNGLLAPDFTKVLHHTPYAKFTLDNYPMLYNPTPEIFVDRTNNTDIDRPTSAVYLLNQSCKKAYILPDDVSLIQEKCPEEYKTKKQELDLITASGKGSYVHF